MGNILFSSIVFILNIIFVISCSCVAQNTTCFNYYDFENNKTIVDPTITYNDGWQQANLPNIGGFLISTKDIGISRLSIKVPGPSDVTFFWYSNKGKSNGYFSFQIDNNPDIRTYKESGWEPVSYHINEAGSHNLKWTFSKGFSEGIYGVIDNICVIQESCDGECPISAPTKIPIFPTRSNIIQNTHENLSIDATRFPAIESLPIQVDDFEKNKVESRLNEILINLSAINRKQNIIESKIEDIFGQKGIGTSDSKDIIYVNSTEKLLSEINNHSVGVIYLKDNIYKGPVNITNDDIKLIAEHKGHAAIDGDNNSFNIKLYDSNGISIEGINLINSDVGIDIERSSECIIAYNSVVAKLRGIRLDNSSNICVKYNNLSLKNNQATGIEIKESEDNYILRNQIDRRKFEIFSSLSHGNVIINKVPIYFVDNDQKYRNLKDHFEKWDASANSFERTDSCYILSTVNTWMCYFD